jgi:phage tail P2-like protein
MSDAPSLLPNNATPLERSLDLFPVRIVPDPKRIATLWDAETCPAHLLPYLAWAFSVDVWDANWPEATRRKVILDAISVHRRKGTIGSVRRALDGIGFNTDVSEWFEYGGTPHTFRIDAFGDDIFAGGFQISPELAGLVSELIENVKPVRSHFTLRIGEKRGGAVASRAGSLQRIEDRRHITPALPIDTHAPQLAARNRHRSRAISREFHRFNTGGSA